MKGKINQKKIQTSIERQKDGENAEKNVRDKENIAKGLVCRFRRKRESGAEAMLVEKLSSNFPKLMEIMKLHIKEAQ